MYGLVLRESRFGRAGFLTATITKMGWTTWLRVTRTGDDDDDDHADHAEMEDAPIS